MGREADVDLRRGVVAFRFGLEGAGGGVSAWDAIARHCERKLKGSLSRGFEVRSRNN